MGYTNKTSHYDLPQWIAGDKPSWLGDVNTAMLNIDTAIAGAGASASAAESSAAAAIAQVQAQEAKITKNATDIQALTENLADTRGEVNNVKTTAEGALPKSGGTMTGNLILNAAPTSDLQAATKKYVDDNSGKGALMLSGGTMTGPLTLNGAPTADLMAATKKYVDDTAGNLVTEFARENNVPNCGAIVINKRVVLTVSGLAPAQLTNPALLTCPGNPLNLVTNTTYSCGSMIAISDTNSVVSLNCVYNGTTTKISAGGSIKETAFCFAAFSGTPINS